MTGDVLTLRQLNRSTLGRQLLLERSAVTPADAVRHLVGLQAQIPLNPYVALWSRLSSFDPVELGRLLTDRELVRIVVMRGTIHLVTGDDCLFLRPLIQPVLDRELANHGEHKLALAELDLEPVLAFARPLLSEQPLSGTKLREALADRFPGMSAAAAAYACRNHLALVQIPPRGVWGKTLQVTSTPAEAWLGRPLRGDATVDEMVLRYLAAFGPASPGDATAWSGLQGMREVFERIRPRLRRYRTEEGRELFDLPEATLTDPDVPAPVRFLPEYDNVLLSHADRSRFFLPAPKRHDVTSSPIHGTVLVDGFVQATWWIERSKTLDRSTLHVNPARSLPRGAKTAIQAEGRSFLSFHEPDVGDHAVDVTVIG